MERRNELTVVANGPKITCAEFEAKMFVRARDTAANVMYYAIGGSLKEGNPNENGLF